MSNNEKTEDKDKVENIIIYVLRVIGACIIGVPTLVLWVGICIFMSFMMFILDIFATEPLDLQTLLEGTLEVIYDSHKN